MFEVVNKIADSYYGGHFTIIANKKGFTGFYGLCDNKEQLNFPFYPTIKELLTDMSVNDHYYFFENKKMVNDLDQTRRCQYCGKSIEHRSERAKTCGNTCKVYASQVRRGKREPLYVPRQ